MNKLLQYYRELMTSLTERLEQGERGIEKLMQNAEQYLEKIDDLSQEEIHSLRQSVERDLREFARNYEENKTAFSDSVFMTVIKESIWQELADVTDRTQLEWQEVLNDLSHHGVYNSGEVVGLGNLVCERCNHRITFYTPEVLPRCPKCGYEHFSRIPFQP